MFDIINAYHVSEAEVLALVEYIQFLLEEVGAIDENISIKTNSKEITRWWYHGNNVAWECKFSFNKLQIMKSWLTQGKLSYAKKSDFVWLELWRNECKQITQRKAIWLH